MVSAELLFGDHYFNCCVPFAAIWGMTGFKGQFLMWPESTPAEIFETMMSQQQGRGPAREDEPSAAHKGPFLKRVK